MTAFCSWPGAGQGPEDRALSRLRRDFPVFRIWRESSPGRTRYITRRRVYRAGLHTVVTDDLDELRATLDAGTAQAPGGDTVRTGQRGPATPAQVLTRPAPATSAGSAAAVDREPPVAPGLTGTGRLADDLWLLAHHELTGKPFVQPRAAGLGLAGGLLAELAVSGGILIRPGGPVVAGPAPPRDQLAGHVRDLVAAEPHPVTRWLPFLARSATADVAWRLASAGYLARVPPRHRWQAGRWVPVDADCAFAPLARVQSALGRRGTAVHGVVLAGLAAACGLGPQLALYLPPNARRRIDIAVAQLDPGLREVITQTRAAVDSAVLAHRV